MAKTFLLSFCITVAIGSGFGQVKMPRLGSLDQQFSIYSNSVRDHFVIAVQLPDNYYENPKAKYPAVYVLDANFQFPMLAATVKQYEKAGLLPPVVLIGIGYRSLALMDSLRVRDYLFPAALPSDEVKAVGGGLKFNDFITGQLIPLVDKKYHTDTNNRSLLGHSFGGYFSLYSLFSQTAQKKATFHNFAAASPSLWYHNFYLDKLPEKLENRRNDDTLNIFITVGGLEDSAWSIAPLRNLAGKIGAAKLKAVHFQSQVFSGLGHMDVATLTFIKALQTFFKHPD